MKPSEPAVQAGGCPCGRFHDDPRPSRQTLRKPDPDLGVKVYSAMVAGKHVNDGDFHWVAYSGNCLAPIRFAANDVRSIFVRYLVRCRRCMECLHARRYYWGAAAIEQTRLAQVAGNRTWFGTLTLSPESQRVMLDRARFASSSPNAQYWDDPKCDFRFAAVRRELVLEVRRYWARLRKSGHRFKYFLVFERHKSGLPHMHWLLHEASGPILKRELQSQWLLGYSNVSLVGGRSKQSVPVDKAAWYVVKYLSKSEQSRQIASKGYRPKNKMRPCGHSSDHESEREYTSSGSTQSDVTRTTEKNSGAMQLLSETP